MRQYCVFLSAAAALLAGRSAGATPVNYQLQPVTAGTYTPLSGGTPIAFSSADDSIASVPLPAGYSFRWFGNPVTTLGVDTNGFISFSSTTITTCAFGCFSNTGLPITSTSGKPLDSLYLWWDDMTTSGATVTYGMETVSGQQVFTVDYHNLSAFSGSSVTISAKVHLYPNGSKIEVIYGPSTGSLAASATVGLQNGQTGSSALYVAGLACSTSGTCGSAQYPANQTLTYLWADKPDLDWSNVAVSNVALSPADGGQVVSLTATGSLGNDGTQPAGAFTYGYYLSQSSTFDSTATSLSTFNVAGLDAGTQIPISDAIQFNRPAMGKYYLLAVADPPSTAKPNGAIDEVDETNNTAALVLYMGTDLTGTISAPATADMGSAAALQVSIINQGVDAPASPFDYKIYASADTSLDTSDVLVQSGTLAPSQLPSNQTLNVTVPGNLPSQDVYWILSIDPPSASQPSGAIAEADETNNVIATTGTTHVNLPDLAVTAVEVRSPVAPNPQIAKAFFGEPVRVRVVVQNLGQASAHNFDVGVYLSGGLGAPVITTHDQLLDDPMVAQLDPAQSVTLDLDVSVPLDSPALDASGNPVPWAAGNFYFGAIADSFGAIGEVNETNNIGKVGPVALRPPAPDFTPVHLDAPAAAAVGEVLPVFRVIRNLGNRGNTGSGDPACPYRYYLSANDIITTEDIPLQILAGGQLIAEGSVKLDVGADDRATDLVQLPPDLSPGTYHLGIIVNPELSVDEIDTTNDALDASGTVVMAPASSLAITTASLPDGVAGVGYQFALSAVGGNGTYAWSMEGGSVLPAGLSFTAGGQIAGIPTQSGTSAFTASVTSGPYVTRARLVLRIDDVSGPLQLVSHALPAAVAGQPYSAQLVAVGGARPYRWTIQGTLPAGLTSDATGLVTGLPAQTSGSAPVQLQVTVADALGSSATGAVSLHVVSASSMRIVTDMLPPGEVGENYPPANTNNQVQVTQGIPPYTYAVVVGALPPGLQLAPDADQVQLQGRPTQAGLFTFTLQVADSGGQVDEHDYAIPVELKALSLAPVPLPAVHPGESYDADLSGAAVRADWGVYSGALPPGLSLDASGHLGGTCGKDATPGAYAFIAQAKDRSGAVGLVAESIQVLGPVRQPPPSGGCSSTGGGDLALIAFLPLGALLLRRRRFAGPFAAALLLAPGLAHAGYTKSTSSASYAPLSGGTPLVGGHGQAAAVNLPFSFRFYGQSYSSISVGTDGTVAFSGQAISASLGGSPAIAAWGDDLDLPSGSSLSYTVSGSAPSRVVIIQWQNADNYPDETDPFSPTNTHFNFQVRLHETTGQIDLDYGSQSTGGFASNASVGITNGQGTVVYGLTSCTTQCSQSNWPTNTQVSLVAGADLSLDRLDTAGLAYQGATSTVTATVSNQGGQDVTGTSVRFWRSTDQVLGNADDVVLGNQAGLNLPAGAQQQVSQSFSLAGLSPGTYYLFAMVDPDDAVTEETKDNNTSPATRLDVVAPAPDLTVPQVQASTHASGPGGQLTARFTLHNGGAVDASNVPYAVYLSTNAVISQSDTVLATGTASGVGANQDVPLTAAVTLPTEILPGSYYLGVIADPNLTLAESNELNNAGYDPTPIGIATGQLQLGLPPDGKLPDTAAGAVYGYQLTAFGGDGQYQFSATSSLPAGLSLSASGLLSGRPTTPGPAPYPLGISVADGSGHVASGQATLLVTDSHLPLTLITQDLVAGVYDQGYSASLSALGGKPPYTWSLTSAGHLPQGVALGSDGTLEGVPHQAGSFQLGIQVQDSAQPPAAATGQLTLVVNPPDRLRAANTDLPDAMLDQPYEAVLGVAGGKPPYLWAFPYCGQDPSCNAVTRFPMVPTDPTPAPSVNLPAGLYFNCNDQGEVLLSSNPPTSGPCAVADLPPNLPSVPKEAGLFTIPAQIQDAGGNSIVVVYTLRVGFKQGIAISTAALPDAIAGKAYDFQLQAVPPDSHGSFRWSLACGERGADGQPLAPCPEGLPSGLTLDADGLIHGQVKDAAAKPATFLVRVADDENRVAVRALSLTPRAAAPAPAKGCASTPGQPGAALALLPLALVGLALRRRRRSI